MRICVLVSSYQDSGSELASLDPGLDPTPWLPLHEVVRVPLEKAGAALQVRALAGQGFDVFLNLCDGTWFEELAGLEVVEELERLGVPFTGPTSRLFALSKEQMKQAALEHDVATPAYVFARSEAEVALAARTLRFPVIVKHVDGFGSIGMTKASCVREPGSLLEQAAQMISLAGGALIEEFIEGREYTVLVAENPEEPARPLVFAPMECVFPAGETFKHFDLKWQSYDAITWRSCPDQHLARELEEATRRIFVGIAGVSYSRCDFRVDARGWVWFLEINTTCGIFYPPGSEGSADMILKADPMGHQGFLEHILRCALLRWERRAA